MPSTPADWRQLDPANTLYLDLASGRVVIELAADFAPAHVANIRTLAKEGYWNALSINRSQDNFVVQWGDAEEEESKRKSLGTAQGQAARRIRTRQRRREVRPPAGQGRLGAAGRVSPTASPPRAIRRRSRRGWRIVTARSAPAAMSPPIPATAPSSTS